MIEFRSVSKTYPGTSRPVVNDLSFEVLDGEICVLVGPSGCGKTTSMRMINRLIEPSERVIRRLQERPGGLTPREAVRAALCEVLPLDEDRRMEGNVWFAYMSRGLVDKKIAEEHEMVFDGARELCVRVTREMSKIGQLAPGLDPDREAARLHALVDGLAVHGLLGRLGEEEMLAVLDTHLGEILRENRPDG